MVDHAGQVSLPGGLIESGEMSQQAALRELEEELGVAPLDIVVLGRLSSLYLFVSNFTVIPWVAATRMPETFVPNPREVAEVLEVPLAHLVDPAQTGRHQRQVNGLEFAAPHIAWGGHHIWGATSMILGEFIAILNERAANAR